jgi:hypothetical protein
VTEPSDANGLLLDLATALGRIEGQNQLILQEQGRAADGRRDLHESLDRVRIELAASVHNVTVATQAIAKMEPDVARMKGFRAQLAIAVFFVTTTVTGAFNLIWIALTHMGEIKAALREFLR